MKTLATTAKSLKSIKIDIKVNDANVDKATRALRALRNEVNAAKRAQNINITANTGSVRQAQNAVRGLTRDIRGLKNTSTAARVNINTSAISQARQQLAALRSAARRPINVPFVNAGGGPGAGAGRPGLGGGRPGGGRPGAPGAGGGGGGGRGFIGAGLGAAGRGFSAGLGGGLGFLGINPAFMAVTAAAYAAAAALKAVTESAATRDRTKLQAAVAATPAQQAIIDANNADKTKDRGPLPYTDDERKQLVTSLLGDVQGEGKTPEERGEARARAAINIADLMEREVLPRQYALGGPDKSPEDVKAGVRKLVQAMNLASTDITDEKGNITKEGRRVLEGIQIAQAADPELTPGMIKTTLANLKTAGYSFSADAIAKTLMNAGNRGVRSANEAYRAMSSATGTIDNKALNEGLANLKLLEGFDRKEVGKKSKKKGSIIPGSGHAVDEAGLYEDPYMWYQQHVVPKMQEDIGKTNASKERMRAAKEAGKTQDEIAAAGEATNAETIAWIGRNFKNMSAAGKQGVADMILGNKQAQQQVEQARLSLKQNVPNAMAKSWTAQWANLKTELENRRAQMGDAMFEKMGLADKLKYLTEAIKNPQGKEAQTLTAGGLDIFKAGLGPLATAAEGLIRGGSLLIDGATALANWFGVGSAPSNPISSQTPEQQTATALKLALADLETANRGTISPYPEERSAAIAEVVRLTKVVNQLATNKAYQEGMIKPDWFDPKKFIQVPPGGNFEKPTGAVPVPAPTTERPTWLDDIIRNLPKPPPETDTTVGGGFGKPLDPSIGITLDAAAKGVNDSSVNLANSVLGLSTANSNFNTTFNAFPQKGTEAGTNVGNSAIGVIQGGAGGAGETFGNSALGVIRSGLSNISINVNANVTGAGASGDKGSQKAAE